MTAPRPNAVLAGLRRRLTCLLYDAILQIGILAAGFVLPQLLLGMFAHVLLPGWASWLHMYGVLGMYFLILWRRNGQTLAMQTWRLKIVDARSGCRPTLPQCLLRYTLAWPSLLFFGAGLLWALLDRDRQFLHDRFAGTCIVQVAPSAPLD